MFLNKMTLASLVVLIAMGLVCFVTPTMAATFPANAEIADISVKQGQVIDITFPTATAAGDGALTATLAGVSPSATAVASGTLQGLVFTFDAATGVGKLTGNASPALVTRVLVDYVIAEADDSGGAPLINIPNATLSFTFEVEAQTDLLEFPAGADIDDKVLTVGTYFFERLPAAQDGIGPLTYSIQGVTTETPVGSGMFTGGDLPVGLTFAPANPRIIRNS